MNISSHQLSECIEHHAMSRQRSFVSEGVRHYRHGEMTFAFSRTGMPFVQVTVILNLEHRRIERVLQPNTDLVESITIRCCSSAARCQCRTVVKA